MPAFPGRAGRPRAIRAPDDGRTEWFTGGADRATRVPKAEAARLPRPQAYSTVTQIGDDQAMLPSTWITRT